MSSTLHDHEFRNVGKRKGSRVRYKCSTCPKLGPWIRVIQPDSITLVEVSAPDPENFRPPKIDYESFGVTSLRLFAKERGLRGYSKMKKDDLVTLLMQE